MNLGRLIPIDKNLVPRNLIPAEETVEMFLARLELEMLNNTAAKTAQPTLGLSGLKATSLTKVPMPEEPEEI